MTTHIARRSLGLLIAFVFVLSAVPPVMAAPVGVPAAPMVGDQIIINEIYRGGTLSGVGDEWIEVVLTQCLTAAQLEGFYVGDSTSSTAAKFSGYRFTNMSSIATTFPAGTVIVVGGTGSVTQNASYNPGGGDWNLLLTTSGANITGNGSNGDLAGTDVAYVDTNGTNGNATLSASGFAVRWGGTIGAFGALANVAITAPGNPGVMALVSDKNGATTAANWVVQTTTLGDPNGGTNTTWITGLRNAGCGDNPPTVSSTVPTNNATGVNPNTTITLNFSEQVDVATGAFTVECPVGTPVTFSSSPVLPASDTTSVVLTPSSALPPSTTCTVTAIATQITDNGTNQLDGDNNGIPGGNYVLAFTTAAADPCTLPATLIHDIQGSGTSSPLSGAQTIQGIVVGDFQSTTQLSGFFVQEETNDWDANALTSEGIFVYQGSSTITDLNLGDKVRLTGTISEFADRTQGSGTMTELTSPTNLQVCNIGNSVTPTDVTLPETVDGDLERYEGMLVRFSNMAVAQNYFVGRYGQMTLSGSGRLFQPTNQYRPLTPDAINLASFNARNLLILDDGRAGSRCGDNPNPVPYLGPPPLNVIRAGDTINTLVGVLDYGQIDSGATGSCSVGTTLFGGDYRLHPTQSPAFTTSNQRPAAPDSVPGNVKVAGANVLNFFNGDGNKGGFPTSRGASTFTEFVRQRIKLYEELSRVNADVVTLMELENDGFGTTSAIAEMVKILNEGPCWNSPTECAALGYSSSGLGANTYVLVTLGSTIGTDEITVGIIYKPANVTLVGTPQTLTATGYTDPNNTGVQKSRPALAASFEENTWGERFTVVANHLKSKGCSTETGLDVDQGDGQGCWNDTRKKGAAYLVNTWLPTDPTGAGDPDYLLMGDMNAYAQEDPIIAFNDSGYTDQIRRYAGTTGYSYIFDGMSGYLDHALANSALHPQVLGTTEWHNNADEPPVIDYNTEFNQVNNYYVPNQYRASDHDPVLVGLGLYPDQSDLASSYGLAWHTGQGALRLGLLWTGEATGTPGGDTGDDGVTIDTSDWRRGGTTAATAVVTRLSGSGNAWLAGWADWNNNGSFADPGERIVNGSVTVGSNTFSSIPIPVDAVVGVPVNMRFRLFDSLTEPAALAPLAASPSGRGNGGEVEDQSIQSIPLAILLAGFNATAQGDAVLVTWDTVSELNNQGFNLYRGGSSTAPETLLGYLPSQAPGSGAGASYQWLDEGLAAGQTFYYWLEAVDLSGATTLHGPVSATMQSPTAVTLSGLEADGRPSISTGWIGAVLFFVIGLASVVLTAERWQRRVR